MLADGKIHEVVGRHWNRKNLMPPIVQISGLSKHYTEGGKTRAVLDSVDLEIQTGEFFVILGKSGSGKSTLLNMISGIDQPDSGRICIDNTDIAALDERRRTLFRV